MILAIDTATRTLSLALNDGNAMVAESSWRSADHHTVELAPMLEEMLKRAGLTLKDLAAIAVALGPGSYTGLRIGMGLAKGLSLAADPPLPLIAIPTLDITAAAQPHHLDRLCVVAQAGRGRINGGFYVWGDEGRWQADGDPFIASWEDLLLRLDAPTQVAGEVDAAARAMLAPHTHIMLAGPAQSLRRAGFLAELAAERLAAGQLGDPATLAPIYVQQ